MGKETIRVLAVDDDEGGRDAIGFILQQAGYPDVTFAKNVKDAIVQFEGNDFDIIISDYRMPGKNGLDFLAWLRTEKGSDTPFVLLTGEADYLGDSIHQHKNVYLFDKNPRKENALIAALNEIAEGILRAESMPSCLGKTTRTVVPAPTCQ